MYRTHFGLREPPFGITPDTSFAFSCAAHQEALNTLLVAASNGEGFIKITGEVGTGKTLHSFARENLFEPLGMGPTEWATGRDGEPFAASGARMSVRDLARIGVMMLNAGKVGEREVVPADWVARCTTPYVSADEVRRYGYQWFLIDIAFGKPKGWAPGRLERMWMAQGEGGQRLFVIPALQLVIAMTHGNYGREDQGIPPTRILREVILASVV